jgi:acyl carrier protein
MTSADLKAAVLQALGSVAPEMVEAELDPKTGFREQLDIDSMDFLNFVIALHDSLGIEIPEADYPRMTSLDAAIAYLAGRMS